MPQRETTSYDSYFAARLAERAACDEVAAPATIESLEEVVVAVVWTDGGDPLVRARVEQAATLFPRRSVVALPEPAGIGRLFMHEVAGVHRELFAEDSDP